jgi:CheY-like chemotaxis protein
MSLLLDREVVHHHALVVDANPTSRSVLLQNLRGFGFQSVRQASRIIDARDLLEHRKYELVICDYHFDNGDESGQDLLEELRREQMLPYSTVFVMVTAEATYAKVAEAAESALDSYLVKPFSAGTLFERVKEARQRKRVLKDIFEAMEARDFERAAGLCLARFEAKQLYWLYAARIGAEILLSLKRNVEAKRLYDAVIAAKTVPWAKLGVARAQLAEGDVVQARRTLEALMSEQPQYADSYDVMGKVQMEQGQLSEALATYRTAAELTPGCILRLQHCGTLSFYAGDVSMATQMLERTWQQGSKSRLFDVLSMMLLAFLRFDSRDAKGLDLAYDVLMRFSEQYPQSVRLRRMAELGTVLITLQDGRNTEAQALARRQADEHHRPDFDMEAATNTLSLWTRLDQLGLVQEGYEALVRSLSRRFCVSKASTEVLCAAVQHQPPAEQWIREAHAEVMRMAEQAMNHALGGKPDVAVEALLDRGGDTGNAKLIDLAGAVAQRHRERIADVDTLLKTAATLAHRYRAPATHIAGVRRSNRSAGGLVLRR